MNLDFRFNLNSVLGIIGFISFNYYISPLNTRYPYGKTSDESNDFAGSLRKGTNLLLY